MRTRLSEFYPHDERTSEALWKSGLFVFDTNVLLSFYLYSPDARKEVFAVLKSLKTRLWIPYRVAEEFHLVRPRHIAAQLQDCSNFLKSLNQLVETAAHARRHPYVSQRLLKSLKSLASLLESEVSDGVAALAKMQRTDPVLDIVTDLYDGRVGARPSDELIDQWRKDAKRRFEQRVPPGFADNKKADDAKIGDVFLWHEVLAHAKHAKKPVVFVTEERKADWWRKHDNELLGPHPALVREFAEGVEQPFHMCSFELFLDRAGALAKKPISTQTVAEVRELQGGAALLHLRNAREGADNERLQIASIDDMRRAFMNAEPWSMEDLLLNKAALRRQLMTDEPPFSQGPDVPEAKGDATELSMHLPSALREHEHWIRVSPIKGSTGGHAQAPASPNQAGPSSEQ